MEECGIMNKVVNFNKCKVGHRHYLGAEIKLSLIYNDKHYMVKFPKSLKEKQNDLNSNYANNVFSEYIGCHIFQSIGVDAQNTVLGTYTVAGNEKIVVGCEDFTTEEYRLHEFQGFQNSFLDSETIGRTPVLEDLIKLFDKHEGLTIRKEAKRRYWDTFVIDALLGNFDRHSANWGYLVDEKTGDMELAPVFDCGSCLYPAISDASIPQILNSDKEIDKRIYQFPRAALKVRGEKIGYHQFFEEEANKDCDEALMRIVPRIDMGDIKLIVDETPMLSDIRKDFLKIMLEKRYEKIIVPVYRRVLTRNRRLERTVPIR